MKRLILALLSSLALQACTSGSGDKANQDAATSSTQDDNQKFFKVKVPAAVHGMVLFGENEIYASHIPMFMIPHDWQALFKVKLSHPTADVMAIYKNARSRRGDASGAQTLLTVQPKPFLLPPLLQGKTTSFEAALFLGNFEDGGRELLKDITVTVEKILEVHHLAPENEAAASLSYYLLKDGKRGYLVHRITAPDNFDQIIEVELPSKLPLAASASLPVLEFGYGDNLTSSIAAGQSYSVTADGKLRESPLGGDQDLKVTGEFYCTVGPDFFETCD